MGRIVWLHPRSVYPARGGAEVRCAGLIALAQSLGHEVMLVHPATGETDRAPNDVTTIELTLRAGFLKWAAKALSPAPLRAPVITRRAQREARSRLAEYDADLCVVSEVLTWGYARSLLPFVPWIYDAHNVEHALWRSHLRNASGLVARVTYLVDYWRVRIVERRLLSGAAAVTCVSRVDLEELRGVSEGARILVVPNSVALPAEAATPGTAGPVVLFVGTLSYPPNIEAVDELVHRVMPLVLRHCPDARLRLVGRRPSATVRDWARSSSFVDLREDVDDVADEYRQARCVVIPMRSGSGTNIKLFEALSYGVPVVVTPKTIEGVDVMDGDGLRVDEQVEDLADATSRLLMDDATCAELGTRGRRVFEDRLSWEGAAANPLRQVLDSVISGQRGRTE